MVVQWEVLAELERFEAVDDDFGEGLIHLLKQSLIVEHAMSPETAEVATDGFVADAQVACHLAVSHAADGSHEDILIEIGSFLPVGGGEGLSTEGALTVLAEKPGYTFGIGLCTVVSDFLVVVPVSESGVVNTDRVRTVGR